MNRRAVCDRVARERRCFTATLQHGDFFTGHMSRGSDGERWKGEHRRRGNAENTGTGAFAALGCSEIATSSESTRKGLN